MNSFLTIQIKEVPFHIAIFILALIVSGCVFETITEKQPGEYVMSYVNFDTRRGETVEVKIGTSFIDFQTADINLKNEIGTKDFSTVYKEARQKWNEKDYEYFLNRSMNYKHIIDSTVGYIRARYSDGSWIEPFDPISEEDYLTRGMDFRPRKNYPYITEGTPVHWTWHVMHDPQGLIKLLGGNDKFIEKLEYVLTNGESYNYWRLESLVQPV